MSQLSKTVLTIVLRSLNPTYHHVEIIHDFWNVLWSESNIFHKNCIFSKLIEISTPVEISNDPDFFHRMDHDEKCIFIFYSLVIRSKLTDLKR